MSRSKTFHLILSVLLASQLHAQQNDKPDIGCGSFVPEGTPDPYQDFLRSGQKFKKNAAGKYVIPVVFHILYTNTTQANMACRAADAVAVANEDFTGQNSDYNSTNPRFNAIKQIMPDVEFCLATKDPNGNDMQYPGMDWIGSNVVSDGYDNAIDNYMWWGDNGKYYLDVAVVNDPNSTGTNGSGHAFFPTQNVSPRIVYNYRYIGRTCGSSSSPGFESVFSHEVGHILGLQHVFNNGCNGTGDGLNDTPLTTGSEGCGDDLWGQCGNYVNTENYMDYNYTCYAMFTQDQVDAMYYWLDDQSQAYYPRSLLWSASNLAAVGCGAATPTADFTASTSISCDGQVTFTDQSVNATSWSWNFGDGNNSTQQNPTHTYASNGTFTVTLTATNANGSNAYASSITVMIPADPVTTNDTICPQGTAHLVSTSPGNGTILWYTTPTGGTPIHSGTSLDTMLSATSTFYVEEDLGGSLIKGGPADNTIGAGANFNTADRRIFFDVTTPVTLRSVKVYATGAGNRTVQVLNSNGVVVHTKTIMVPDGESRITLDFNLAPGTDYAIKCNVDNGEVLNLYRNSAGVSYPYSIGGLVSITSSDAAGVELDYYYFFYDWEIREQGCISNRVPVTGTVDVCTGVNTTGLLTNISLYPNPVNQTLFITLSNPSSEEVTVSLHTITGKDTGIHVRLKDGITAVNTEMLPPGVYILKANTKGYTINQKLIKAGR